MTAYKKIKYLIKILNKLFSLWWSEKSINKKLIKPDTINLNANDICNSKCTMCNIWKQKKSYEITYEDLKNIFSDSFYSDIKHVGITGGEPTLRADLVDLFKACIDFLPNLKGLSIITNCIKQDDVKIQLKNIYDLCKKNGIEFHVMVSLDGVGEIHDKIRGRKGNFESTIAVIKYLKEDLKIPVTFGATISKNNVWEIDELLDFAKQNNLYGRFRVAEFIKRLYNDDRNDVIRNFNEDEKYHLALFFEKLKRTYENNSTFNRTYSSIQNILLGGNRLIGCPYHKNGILLNSQGEVAYCAPKSKIIGNALEKSTTLIYLENLKEKERILLNDCESCIHDYHATITFNEQYKIEKASIQNFFLNINSSKKVLFLSTFFIKPNLPKFKYSILIVGWYGTETVGDKAILAGIIQQYKNKYGNELNVIIASLYPFITERTINELAIEAKVVNSNSLEFLVYSKYCNEIIVGGGPLMDLAELYVPLLSFTVAKKYNQKRTIYGCGLGPIFQTNFKNAIHTILKIANEIKLRDFNSQQYAKMEFGIQNTEMIGDPAEEYVIDIGKIISPNKKNELSLFLRDWTFEYARDKYTYDEFLIKKIKFENSLANFIKEKALELGVDSIVFNHMHNFVIGNDDRDFSRKFIKEYFFEDPRVSYVTKLSTVESVIEAMKSSKMNICMRFHSVLFAHKLGVDYIAIDYTLGGKIEAFLSQNDSLDYLLSVNQLIKKCNYEASSY